MALLVILVVLGLRQFWEDKNPLHRDQWYARWYASLEGHVGRYQAAPFGLLLATGLPVICIALLAHLTPFAVSILLSVVVLSYSLGRGLYSDIFQAYRSAVNGRRWDEARDCLKPQPAESDFKPVEKEAWDTLHKRMLNMLGYQGFERIFAVVFWFLLFGPAGALLYRLSVHNVTVLCLAEQNGIRACRWLWALEWIPARILSLSFAITGNFVGCVNKLSSALFNFRYSTAHVINECVLGALSLDDVEVASDIVTLKEVTALKHLLSRTLWLWLGVLAAYLVFSGG